MSECPMSKVLPKISQMRCAVLTKTGGGDTIHIEML